MVYTSTPLNHAQISSPNSSKNKTFILNLWKRLKSPKTNYTYSKSLSYSPQFLKKSLKDYLIPNMSRDHLKHKKHSKTLTKLSEFDPQYKEEYRMIKSATYSSNKNPNKFNFSAKSIPNLYGLDVSEDESNQNYTYRNSYLSFSTIFNYMLNILYNIWFFILYLLQFGFEKIKSLLCAISYPIRYFLASGFSNAYGYMNGSPTRFEDVNGHHSRADHTSSHQQHHHHHTSSASEDSDVGQSNEAVIKHLKKTATGLRREQKTNKKHAATTTRIRQSERLNSPAPSQEEEVIRPKTAATFRSQPPKRRIASPSKSSYRSKRSNDSPTRKVYPNLESYNYQSSRNPDHEQGSYPRSQLESSHGQGTLMSARPWDSRRSSSEYVNSVVTGLGNIGSSLRHDLFEKFRSAREKYCATRNYLTQFIPGSRSAYSGYETNYPPGRRASRGRPRRVGGDENYDSDYYSGGYTDYRSHMDTLKNLYRRRRHRQEGLSLCSFPCPFLLFFFLLPLLLATLLKRFGYDNHYLMNKPGIKEFYSPIKNKIDGINEKIYENLPNIPGVPENIRNMTRLPSLIYNDTLDFLYDKGKWLKDSNINPLNYNFFNSSDSAGPGIFQKGLENLITDLDAVKMKLASLEKSYFHPPPDEDWWKLKSDGDDETRDRDVRVIIKDTIDKGLRQIKSELDRASGGSRGGTADSTGTSKLGDRYYESLTGVIDDLKNKFKSFTERTKVQEENVAQKIDSMRDALYKMDKQGTVVSSEAGGGNIKSLVSRVDVLARQLDDLTNQLRRAETDTTKLSDFAKSCCSGSRPASGGMNEAAGGDINLLLSKIDLSDMDPKSKEKFITLLRDHFASHHKVDELQDSLHHNLDKINKELLSFKNNLMEEVKSISTGKTSSTVGSDKKISYEEKKVREIVEEMLDTYSADQLGMPDYALESAGGAVVSTRCSETYDTKSALIKVLGVPVWYKSNSPRIAIQPGTQPGQCWAFKGSAGYFVVQLAADIYPTAFSIDHIPRALSPSGDIDSAPKDFSVWGLKSEKDIEGTLLGRYRFEKTGRSLQLFLSQNPDAGPFAFIELKIESNWGNPNYTCLYRFRVHGKLAHV